MKDSMYSITARKNVWKYYVRDCPACIEEDYDGSEEHEYVLTNHYENWKDLSCIADLLNEQDELQLQLEERIERIHILLNTLQKIFGHGCVDKCSFCKNEIQKVLEK